LPSTCRNSCKHQCHRPPADSAARRVARQRRATSRRRRASPPHPRVRRPHLAGPFGRNVTRLDAARRTTTQALTPSTTER
jgi:hypothetical protein